MNKLRLLVLFFSLHCLIDVAYSADMELTPFSTSNQSPLVMIYGLPHDSSSGIIPPGKFRIHFNQDYTSNYTVNNTPNEKTTLDGETYRVAITARYGIAPRWETGMEIPYIFHGGGFLDNFIINWHNMFGMPQGGRDLSSNNIINYSYSKNNETRLKMNHNSSGIGDLSFTGGYQLYDTSDTKHRDQLALKGAIKLPTGDSSSLLGSGSTDVALQLCGSTTIFNRWGSMGLFGAAGGVAMSKSDVLPDQHKTFAGFGTFGLGWAPNSWISFKAQLNGITPLYRNSSLAEVSKQSVMTIFGGAIKLPGEHLLDIGVAEDLFVGTAPDVSFHLGLSKQF